MDISELLFPRTDAGVGVQLVLLIVATLLGLWATRSNRDLRILVIGLGLILLAGFGLRAAH